MNYKPYKHLPPFKGMVLQNFPFIEEDFDAITNYQLLCKVVEYLRNVIANELIMEENITNLYNSFTELKNYVDDYFKNLDVQEEINNKLDEMALDGTLENIIGNILNKTNGELTFNTIYKNVSEYINGISNDEIPMTGYVQGMCTTDNTIIIAYQTGGALHDKTNMIFLTEIDKETKTILKQRYLELFHANSLAYNKKDSEIYVATTSYFDEEFVSHPKNDIIVLDYNTFDIKETIQPSTEITNTNRVRSVAYDNITNKLYLGDVKDIWEMIDFTNIKTHIELEEDMVNPLTNNTMQNFVVCNNVIYVTRTYPNGINMYDKHGKLLKNYYDFTTDIDTFLIEVESLYVEENGDIYVVGTNYSRNDNTYFREYETVIIKSNLISNGYLTRAYSGLADTNFNVYVDCATTNTRQNGSQSYPYKTIQQAINFINYIDKDIQFIINLVGTQLQYSCFVTKTSKNIVLNANNNYIYACQIENQRMIIRDLRVNGTNFVNFSESYPTPIRITNNSKIIFTSLRIENSGEVIDNGIYISNSDLDILQANCSKLTNFINMENGYVKLNAKNLTFSNVTNYWKTGLCCFINYESNANKNRCNADSSHLPFTPFIQLINKTFADNTITFTNPNFDTGTTPYHLYLAKIGVTINSVEYTFNTLFYDGVRTSCSFNDNNYIYDVQINITHPSTGNYVLTPKVFRTNKSTGIIDDITSNITLANKGMFVIL